MSSCQNCGSDRILGITAKTSDRFYGSLKHHKLEGYAPNVDGICGGDYIETDICLNCGQVQGTFPVELLEVEQGGEWTEFIEMGADAPTDVDAISETVSRLMDAIIRQDVIDFDVVTDGVFNIEHVVAALRASFSFRHQDFIQFWDTGVERASEWLDENMPEQHDDIMYGLITK